jgi:hypothetical protein
MQFGMNYVFKNTLSKYNLKMGGGGLRNKSPTPQDFYIVMLYILYIIHVTCNSIV